MFVKKPVGLFGLSLLIFGIAVGIIIEKMYHFNIAIPIVVFFVGFILWLFTYLKYGKKLYN